MQTKTEEGGTHGERYTFHNCFDCGPFLQLEQGVGNTDAVADQKLLQLLSFLLSGTEDSSEFHQTKLPKLQQQGRQVQQAVQVDSLQAVLNYRGAQESGYKSISLQPLLLHSSGVINHPGKAGVGWGVLWLDLLLLRKDESLSHRVSSKGRIFART